MCAERSEAPERRSATPARRDATGVDILRGLTLKRLGEGPFDSTLGTPAELVDALRDLFGPDLASVGEEARAALLGQGPFRPRRLGGGGPPVASHSRPAALGASGFPLVKQIRLTENHIRADLVPRPGLLRRLRLVEW